MKSIRGSFVFKMAVWVLLTACTFFTVVFGAKVLAALPYTSGTGEVNWQDNGAFQTFCSSWSDRVATAVADEIAVKSSIISYVERQQLESALAEFQAAIDPNVSSYRFRLLDAAGQEVMTNLPEGETLMDTVQQIRYATFSPGEYFAQQLNSYDYYAQYYGWQADSAAVSLRAGATAYILEYGVAAQPQGADIFTSLYQYCQKADTYLMRWVALCALMAVGALCALAAALWCAGWQKESQQVELLWLDRIYTEFWVMAAGLGALLCGVLLAESWDGLMSWYYNGLWPNSHPYQLLLLGAGAGGTGVGLWMAMLLRTVWVRKKLRALARSTLLCRVLMGCWRGAVWCMQAGRVFVFSLPFLWRLLALFGIYFFADLLLYNQAMYDGWVGLFWFALNVAVLLLLCWWAIGFQRLREGSRAIAGGNLNHQIDTHRMPQDLQNHAEDLNSISSGLQEAVNEQMKSERFKAELITNVSHDLKTPLTSIINYVDLLKTTQQTDPKAQEYIEVLDRKAQRLKKLTEDLVEASKASTGTLKVNREKIGMTQLIDQALGEYEEKLVARQLSVITALPEDETYVYADGRHLWRVIDNLLSNCCKYAMNGTRVYLELTRGKGQVVLSVKNISREPLNIPAERLMERFVRGEESRSTEGSGLGLSIARSLTELQGGTFDLAVDGDLFKAIVTMPQAG